MAVLTLLTDFGSQDSYVACMKGVILGIAPEVTIVDLTHEIKPQDIAAGRFQFQSTYRYFPKGTIHLAVVDPGVGGDRRPIAFATETAFFVGPDNGLLTGIEASIVKAVKLDRPEFWLTANPSSTFHGRDIFAPVAARLSLGLALENLGSAIDPASLIQITLPVVQHPNGEMEGCVQAIDRFGNLITNLKIDLDSNETWELQIANHSLLVQITYSNVKVGELVAIVGSHGFVEIAVNQGSAQDLLGGLVGDRVKLYLKN